MTQVVTVIVENGTMTGVDGAGRQGVDLPAPPFEVDGQGKVLMLGLVNFHAHLGITSGKPPRSAYLFEIYPGTYE